MPNDIWGSVWPSLAAYVIAGIAVYLFDRKWGVHIYRFLYDLFHSAEKAMPKDVEIGFFYKQPTKSKFVRALLFAAVTGFWPPFSVTGANIVAQIILPLFQAPVFLLGFGILGTVAHFVLRRKDKIFDTVDTLGEHVSKEGAQRVAKQAGTIGADAVEKALNIPRAIKDAILPEAVVPAAPAPEAPALEPVPEEAPAEEAAPPAPKQSAIDKFVNRGR